MSNCAIRLGGWLGPWYARLADAVSSHVIHSRVVRRQLLHPVAVWLLIYLPVQLVQYFANVIVFSLLFGTVGPMSLF